MMLVRRRTYIAVFVIAALSWAFSLPRATSAQTEPVPVQCGDIIETEWTPDNRNHYYGLELSAGDSVYAQLESIGPMVMAIGVDGPGGFPLKSTSGSQIVELEPSVIPASGTYVIETSNVTPDRGFYTLYIGCTLRNGAVIEPGDTVVDSPSVNAGAAAPAFSGYGFPGINPVDFSAGMEIPLTPGQTYNGALTASGSDVFSYTYEATANAEATLSLRRISGNLSVGVAVIDKADNSIVFLAAMPSSNELTTRLTFPNEGTFTIGVFRMDLPEQTGTSGAFELRLE